MKMKILLTRLACCGALLCTALITTTLAGCGTKEVTYEIKLTPEQQKEYDAWREQADKAIAEGKQPPPPPMPDALRLPGQPPEQ